MYDGYWPSRSVTAADRDPAFDSVIVIWQANGWDFDTSSKSYIGGWTGGLTWAGADQSYTAAPIASVMDGTRNIFKHEWSHAAVGYYHAIGAAPEPFANPDQAGAEVNCVTGKQYDSSQDQARTPRSRTPGATINPAKFTTSYPGRWPTQRSPTGAWGSIRQHGGPEVR